MLCAEAVAQNHSDFAEGRFAASHLLEGSWEAVRTPYTRSLLGWPAVSRLCATPSDASGSDLLQTRAFPDERGSPSAAPLLAISRVSGVVWLVVAVIASLAAPGAPSTSDASRRICGLDD